MENSEQIKTFSEYFVYDENSPSCLVRKKAIYSGRLYTTLVVSEGTPCGFMRSGYWLVKVKQKPIFCHKIIWALHHGEFGNHFEIDHINGNSLDNRIENLRSVDHQTNCQNRSLRSDSKTGVTGVNYASNGLKYRARWAINKKNYAKNFDTMEEAIEYRLKMLKITRELGESYTERHGL